MLPDLAYVLKVREVLIRTALAEVDHGSGWREWGMQAVATNGTGEERLQETHPGLWVCNLTLATCHLLYRIFCTCMG